jgi:hypothetical protein
MSRLSHSTTPQHAHTRARSFFSQIRLLCSPPVFLGRLASRVSRRLAFFFSQMESPRLSLHTRSDPTMPHLKVRKYPSRVVP